MNRARSSVTWAARHLVWISLALLMMPTATALGQDEPPADQPLYGFDVLVGARGSTLELMTSSIYYRGVSGGNIPFSVYLRFLQDGDLYKYARIAVPIVMGDTLNGRYRIVGTLPKMFGLDDKGNPLPKDEMIEYRAGLKAQFADGKCFELNKFEAVVGCDIPKLTGKKIGDTFQAVHGAYMPGVTPEIHTPVWKVVGVLAPTHTAIDRAVYIPLPSFYAIDLHGDGLTWQNAARNGDPPPQISSDEDADKPHPVDAKGIQHFKYYDFDTQTSTFKIKLPPDAWAVSAIEVQSRGGETAAELEYDLSNSAEGVMAIDPEATARDLPRPMDAWVTLGFIPGIQAKDSRIGVRIAATMTDSPAVTAGLKRGDVVLQVNDKDLNNCLDLLDAMGDARTGDKVRIKFRRGNGTQTVDLTLADDGRKSGDHP